MKFVSWNVNGLRSILGKGLNAYLVAEGADVVCLQEIKARPEQIDESFGEYQAFWNPARRPGYSGTMILTKIPPLGVVCGMGDEEHDGEGRLITAEFPDFFLVNVYTPNSKRDLSRLDYRVGGWTTAFIGFLRGLEARKPVVFCGDLNVAHKEIDLARPKENTRNAGFTDEERTAFDRMLAAGYFDSFRSVESGGGHYSWWSYQGGARSRNVGWRIDYFCVSEALRPRLTGAFIRPETTGSDHCPVGATFDL